MSRSINGFGGIPAGSNLTEMLEKTMSEIRRSAEPEMSRINSINMDATMDTSNVMDLIDKLCMAASHTSCTADDLADWAKDAVTPEESVGRWQAVAVTRDMACKKWAEATRQLYSVMSPTV